MTNWTERRRHPVSPGERLAPFAKDTGGSLTCLKPQFAAWSDVWKLLRIQLNQAGNLLAADQKTMCT
jgi:hypothetical protein